MQSLQSLVAKIYLKTAILFTILLASWAGMRAHAQAPEQDALRAQIDAATSDTARCRLLEELVYLLPLEEQMPDLQRWKRIAYSGYLKATTAAERVNLLGSLATAFNEEGYIHIYTDQPDLALKPFQASLSIDQWLGNPEEVAASLNNIGYQFEQKGNPLQALAHYEQAVSIELRNQDTTGLQYTLGNIASLHEVQENYDLALKNYFECLKISQLIDDSVGIGRAYNYITHVYIRMAQYESAYEYCQSALAIWQHQDAPNFEVAAHSYLAFIDLKRQNYERALQGYDYCLQVHASMDYAEGIAINRLDRSEVWLALGQLDKAEQDALQAHDTGMRVGLPDLTMNAAQKLAEIYARKQDYKQALAMQLQYTTLHDSLQNRKTEKSLLRTQFQYEYAQKAVADSIQNVQAQAISDLQFAQQKSQKRWLLLLVALVALFALFIWNRFRVTRRQNRQIEVANQDLSRQHLLNQKIFSVISHDFRGPILSLNLMLDALRDRNLDAGLRQFVGEVNAEVRNANEVLNSLLNWAKTEINIPDFQQNTASLQAISVEIVEELGPKIKDKEIIVHQSFTSDATIALPPDILRIVLRNLLSNAIKFSHHGQAVEIAYDAGRRLLAVRDHGIGISAAKQARLFGQAVDTDLGTAHEEGFGMGLYIVAELLHKYDHAISVESTAATGTTFSIRPNRVN